MADAMRVIKAPGFALVGRISWDRHGMTTSGTTNQRPCCFATAGGREFSRNWCQQESGLLSIHEQYRTEVFGGQESPHFKMASR